jgi:peptide/nickel transport system substrate-binding protein
MFRRKGLAAVAATAALALVLSACGGGNDNPSPQGGTNTPGKGGTLTLGLIAPATTFLAADMNFANESPYGQAVYDTLLRADPDLTLKPSLATKWEYNADKTVLTMELRNDVTFTDGTKFTADVAAQNLTRFAAGASPQKSNLADLKEAKATDETHLTITLKQSNPAFLAYLSQNAGMQGSPKAFTTADNKTNPVGSGPYILDTAATVIGSSYEFKANPNYWDKANQHYEKLVLKVLGDPTAMLNAIRGKQLNGAKLINNDALDQVKGGGYSLIEWELDWWGMILFDRAGKLNPAMKEVKVRQAINHAFDRGALCQAIGKGFCTATTQVFPQSSEAYVPALDQRYPFDPAKAKSLLAEAGYPNGFTLAIPMTTRLGTAVYAILTQQLADIGITVTATDVGTNFIPDQLAAKYSASLMALQQDPSWALINFKIGPNATWNAFKYQDPKVDELMKAIHAAGDDKAASAQLKELNTYIVEQAWFAPWYRTKNHYALDAKTTGLPQPGNAYPYLWNFKPKA